MNFTSKEVAGIAEELLVEDRIEKSQSYDWLDIVGITQRPEKLKKSLYFAT